jgi:hypothetical protein
MGGNPRLGTSITPFVDMSRFLQTHSSCAERPFFLRSTAVTAVVCVLVIGGCGEVTCPEPLSEVDGTCQKLDPVARDPVATQKPEPDVERCDGVDNDSDSEADEDWPELGEPCGERAGVGECVAGEYVCAGDGTGVLCEGALGPGDEVCDGKDNDCDGLVDEGVLSVKGEVFADYATVATVEGGFAVTRVVGEQLRVETYDTSGNRTGHHDDIDRPTQEMTFLESDSWRTRVLVALGQFSFHVVDVYVGSDLIPIIVGTQELHDDWRQGTLLGVFNPPIHPRVLAFPSRFLGYRDIVTFALNPLASGGLAGLAQEPTVASELPVVTAFDAAGPVVVWEQDENLRAGLLRDDGVVLSGIDVARGEAPGIAMGNGEAGLVYLQGGSLHLTELGVLSLQCFDGGLCNETMGTSELGESPAGPTGLAFDEASDSWFVVAGTQLVVVGRGEAGAVIKQVEVRDVVGDSLNRVDVAVSGGTAAVVQASKYRTSAVTFLGCF